MRVLYGFIGVCLGVVLGISLLFVGVTVASSNPPPARCPGCVILTHPYYGCNEQVVGGWICP